MKNLIKMLMIIMIALTFSVACSSVEKDNSKESTNADDKVLVKRVAITQIVEHPSLDSIREGIIQALVDGGYEEGENIEIDFLNAQGSMENTMTIASEFESKNYDLVVGISTPSAQALFNKVKNTPIVYSAVTDPSSAGLVGDNISGVSDMTPIRKQIELLVELIPTAKKIGMIYNSSELNSEIQVNIAKEIALEMGLEIVVTSITNSNEVSSALEYILDNSDVLYVQKDNTLASAFPIIVKKADAKNIPIIGSTKDYVDSGALATDGPSEFQIGYQTGEMIIKVLGGEDIKNIEAELVDDTKREFNLEVAKKYNIQVEK